MIVTKTFDYAHGVVGILDVKANGSVLTIIVLEVFGCFHGRSNIFEECIKVLLVVLGLVLTGLLKEGFDGLVILADQGIGAVFECGLEICKRCVESREGLDGIDK